MYLNLFQKTNPILATSQTNKNPNNLHQISLYNIKQPKKLNHNIKNSQQINTTQQH